MSIFTKNAGFVYLCLYLSACMTVNSTKITDPTKRLAIAGVAILPPQEQGWYIVSNTKQRLNLVKKAKRKGETYAINVSLFKMPVANTIEEFLEHVKKQRTNEPQSDRFKIISSTEKIYKKSCVALHIVSKDYGAIGKVNSEYMLLETASYNCSHKNASSIGVNITYSHRYYPDSQTENIQERSQSFLKNIKLVPFKLKKVKI